MTTLGELAIRTAEFIGIRRNGSTLTADDSSVIVKAISDTLTMLMETYAGREFYDTQVSSSMTLEDDMRAIVTTSGLTLTCPATPQDGARFAIVPVGTTVTIAPNQRLLQGLSGNVAVGAATEWIYRADLGDWIAVPEFLSTATIPYAPWADGPLHMIAGERVAPTFGRTAPEAPVAEAKALISARYGRPRAYRDAG